MSTMELFLCTDMTRVCSHSFGYPLVVRQCLCDIALGTACCRTHSCKKIHLCYHVRSFFGVQFYKSFLAYFLYIMKTSVMIELVTGVSYPGSVTVIFAEQYSVWVVLVRVPFDWWSVVVLIDALFLLYISLPCLANCYQQRAYLTSVC